MDWNFLVPLLMMFTLLAGLVIGLVMKKHTDDRRRDPNSPRSALASDMPDDHKSEIVRD